MSDYEVTLVNDNSMFDILPVVDIANKLHISVNYPTLNSSLPSSYNTSRQEFFVRFKGPSESTHTSFRNLEL